MAKSSVGLNIARVREDRGISQSELARKLGVSPQAVQKWEAGGSPRTTKLEAIAEALGVTSSDLVAMQPGDTPLETRRAQASAEKWPFSFSKRRFDQLPPEQKARIDGFALGLVSAWESSHPESSAG